MLNAGYAQLDVPTGRRPIEVANHIALIGVAHAATLERAPRMAVVERPGHGEEHPHLAPREAASGTAAGWAVQVGVYSNERVARAAAVTAHRVAEDGDPRVERAKVRGRPAWRAQLIGLTGPEATGACARLSHHRTPCLVLRPEAREMASR